MSDIAIKVENLSKLYKIGVARHDTLRDAVTHGLSSILRRTNGRQTIDDKPSSIVHRPPSIVHRPSSGGEAEDTIWALKDVSFEVQRGEVVGIIGRNGAGKSTLLKILSRITEPTSGRAIINGRVGSLLEVGTGFHPELTGRENIYLNGAILGMKKAEIERKFDEIVAFAEIEKFMDTPVKRYSSGMYVRLAFAVAAHLEPEILVVDEVLAVGDAAFQKKCLGKMGDVAKEGRTVLFVSHQMGAIAQLCNKALLLGNGAVTKQGDTQPVIDYYLGVVSSQSQNGFTATSESNKAMFITKAQALNSKGEAISHFTHKEQIIIAISCKINQWVPNTVMGFFIRDHRCRKVFTNNNPEWANIDPKSREVHTTVTIPSNFLVPGQYMFTFAISAPHVSTIDWVEDILAITIVDGGSVFSAYEGYDYGCVFADCKWAIGKKT
ncbi:MAG: ABC transporter ATP-binding protein [Chloroflexi bacterium]|nr:ABC transporter ATP-binding protein [Chloroflexota bacterium]